MRPWERRLKDLAQLLENCQRTYLEPDLFRMNTNQFLQTSRTVTFIIQKNKASIPGFGSWYEQAVTQPWALDVVMRWAKDARNTIEKEGDLDLHSSLNLTLMFSYLSEEDVKIDCGRSELLHAGITALMRLSKKHLPRGVADAAAVKIERRWVTASLPEKELLAALTYVYVMVYQCCRSLAEKCGTHLERSIPDPATFEDNEDEVRKVRYLKLSDLEMYSLEKETRVFEQGFEPPETIRSLVAQLPEGRERPGSIEGVYEFLSKMVGITFDHYGYHEPMLFLYDDRWKIVEMISGHFVDQTDKFIFWRRVADRIATLGTAGLSWIAESWIRNHEPYDGSAPIGELPIIGERVHLNVLDKSGNHLQRVWRIERKGEHDKPTLRPEVVDEYGLQSGVAYCLFPVRRAMGLQDQISG